MFIRIYAKSLLAVVATIITGVVAALSDNTITPTEWLNVGILAATAASVFTGPNVPGAPYTKAILAVIGAALTFLSSALVDGISAAEWGQVAVVALAAVGVGAVGNAVNPVAPDLHQDWPVVVEPTEWEDPNAFPAGDDGDLPGQGALP